MLERRGYSQRIAAIIQCTLEDMHPFYGFHVDEGMFTFTSVFRSIVKVASYQLLVLSDAFTVFAFLPISAPNGDMDMMVSVAEFVFRANYDLAHAKHRSKLEIRLEQEDDHVYLKCFFDCDKVPLTKVRFQSMMKEMDMLFQRYCDGLIRMIYGGASAKDAYHQCLTFECDAGEDETD